MCIIHKRYICKEKKERERWQKTGHKKLQGHLYINSSQDIKKRDRENSKRKINNKKEGER
jgi:hypothetical protein